MGLAAAFRASMSADLPWSVSPADRAALQAAPDWAELQGLEQIWPVLAERHGDAIALEAPHARPPQTLSYRELHSQIERVAAAFASLGLVSGEVVALFRGKSAQIAGTVFPEDQP